ncbi:MAG: APC family permease [Promethearchaeota archaeon]
MSSESDSEPVLTSQKRKKFSWIVVAAMVVGTIVGSGIVKDSVLWVAKGGSYALYGVFLVWFAFFIVGLAMCDNVYLMPKKGGVYAWARETMGNYWGIQIGWIYIVGYTCLSVILSWLAYINTLVALTYFFPEKAAFFATRIFSIIIPLFFIALFTLIFALGVKNSTQVIVAFFTIKTTMWLTIVGIGLLHFEGANIKTQISTSDVFGPIFTVATLSVFAMLGLDSASVIIDDIHEPEKNFLRGLIVGMFIVLILYLSTIIMILGIVGSDGAQNYVDNGITGIFLDILSMPPLVLLVFIVISIIGTLFITMYLVVRLTGAMAENKDFYFSKFAIKNLKDKENLKSTYKVEMPKIALLLETMVYAIFFFLIYIESYYGTYFVLYCMYYMGIISVLVILFFICYTNFRAYKKGIGKKEGKKISVFRRIRGFFIPLFGMLIIALVIYLTILYMWTSPAFPLPGPSESKYRVIWQWLGKIVPLLFFIPGLLFWITTRSKNKIKKDS